MKNPVQTIILILQLIISILLMHKIQNKKFFQTKIQIA